MPIRNNHWYDLNDQRKYPLDDIASCVSDAGNMLPPSLLADLRLHWPKTYGRYGFLSSCAVGPRLITALFAATTDLDDPDAPVTLLAGYTGLRRDATRGRAFALQSFCPGAGGFVVFGSVLDSPYSGRFSRPRQSLLSPRAAWGVRVPPVRTLGVEHAAQAFSRLVQVSADLPLEIVKESREIEGVLQSDVIVFRLQAQTQPLQLATRAETVLASFAGPCGSRVGAGTCGEPAPILSINGVTPDCDGVITLDFRNCATVGKNTADCGVVLDCGMSLDQICAPPYLPTLDTGELPYEVITGVVIPPTPPPVPEPPPEEVSSSFAPDDTLYLPYCNGFDVYSTAAAPPAFFSYVGDSDFSYVVDDSPEPLCAGEPTFCQIVADIPDLFRWYNAARGIVVSSPGRVATWQDQSSNGAVLVNTDLAEYDPYVVDGASPDAIAGRPTVGLDITRWLGSSAPGLHLSGAVGFTVAAVFRYRATRTEFTRLSPGGVWSLTDSRVSLGVVARSLSLWYVRLLYRKSDTDLAEVIGGPLLSLGDTVVAIGRVSYAAGNVFAELEVNGIVYTGDTPVAGVIQNTPVSEILAYADTFSIASSTARRRALPSDTAEIVVYSRAITEEETNSLRDCLVSKYSLAYLSSHTFPPVLEWCLSSVEVYDPTLPVVDDQVVTVTTPSTPSTLRFKLRGTPPDVPDHLDLPNDFFLQTPFVARTLVKGYEGYDNWNGNWMTGSTVSTWGVAYTATYTSVDASKTVTWLLNIYRDPGTTGWLARSRCTIEEFDSGLSPHNRQLKLYAAQRFHAADIFDSAGLMTLDSARESVDSEEISVDAEATSDEFLVTYFNGLHVVATLQWV